MTFTNTSLEKAFESEGFGNVYVEMDRSLKKTSRLRITDKHVIYTLRDIIEKKPLIEKCQELFDSNPSINSIKLNLDYQRTYEDEDIRILGHNDFRLDVLKQDQEPRCVLIYNWAEKEYSLAGFHLSDIPENQNTSR